MPAFSLVLGGVMVIAFWLGGRPGDGLKALGVMAAVGALFLLGSRSDMLRGLGGPDRDERWAMIDARATGFAGLVVVAAAIGLWLYEVANGDDGSPYIQLLGLAGIAYILAIAWLRRRS